MQLGSFLTYTHKEYNMILVYDAVAIEQKRVTTQQNIQAASGLVENLT